MNQIIQGLVASLQGNVNNAKQLGLKLNIDYPADVSGEAREWGLQWQEVISQQSRGLLMACSQLNCGYQEFRACLSVIEATIPLLEGSRYAEIQKERAGELRSIWDYNTAFKSALCA